MNARQTPLPDERRPDPQLVSFVIPIYNEEEVIPFLRERLMAFASTLSCTCEWLLVSDGSRDASPQMLVEWAREDPRAKVILLARNFGHQAAVTAGLDHAVGDAVVVMDADLQDPPELVHTMLERYREGYDVAYAQRTSRQGENPFKQWTALLFYDVMTRFVHPDLPKNAGDFRLLSRRAADAMGGLREGQRFLRGMVTWLGFYQVPVPFDRPARVAGTTKYPLRKMLALAWDAILSFSSSPLRFAAYLGGGLVVFGLMLAGYAFSRQMIYHDLVPGWTPLVVLHGLIGGGTLMCLGLIGEYVGRIYDEIKQRPIYIVARTENLSVHAPPRRAIVDSPPRPPVRESGPTPPGGASA